MIYQELILLQYNEKVITFITEIECSVYNKVCHNECFGKKGVHPA